MSVKVTLWDFMGPSPGRENLIQRWAKKERLSKRDRGRLNEKCDFLERAGFALALGTRTLAGPVYKQHHIYKLIAHGDVMLRPMLCKGPPENQQGEMTILQGAIERDYKLDPADAPERAEEHRLEVVDNDLRRGSHERF